MIESKIPPRRPDWRARLTAYISQVSVASFRPGALDCALFAADAVEAQTGFDPASEWRGSYKTLDDGQRQLLRAGFADHVAFAADLLPEIAPSRASVGDIAVVASGVSGAVALGVVQGPMVYCLHIDGPALVSRLSIIKAFRV